MSQEFDPWHPCGNPGVRPELSPPSLCLGSESAKGFSSERRTMIVRAGDKVRRISGPVRWLDGGFKGPEGPCEAGDL